MLFTLEKLLKV